MRQQRAGGNMRKDKKFKNSKELAKHIEAKKIQKVQKTIHIPEYIWQDLINYCDEINEAQNDVIAYIIETYLDDQKI